MDILISGNTIFSVPVDVGELYFGAAPHMDVSATMRRVRTLRRYKVEHATNAGSFCRRAHPIHILSLPSKHDLLRASLVRIATAASAHIEYIHNTLQRAQVLTLY